MTRKQYEEMAQNFSKFSNMFVGYKVLNKYYQKGRRRFCGEKYLSCMGQLWGVGIGANTESFIIAKDGHLQAIHFKDITWPL